LFCKNVNIISRQEAAIDIKRKNRLLKVCYVPATSATFLNFFLAVAINSTNEANKAGSVRR
jgi:hypothetical protein